MSEEVLKLINDANSKFYLGTPSNKISIGKIDVDNVMVVDYRSEKAIEASNNITAYSLTKGAK